jgi:ABC-type Na+ transport system ATPase subunit NatA
MYQPPRLNRSGMQVIGCTRLTKRFGPVTAVSKLDLDVAAGQVYGFLGPNGAGKTTTIRMRLGLIAPTAGQARLLGRTLPDPRAVAQTGSMIEEPAFYPWLSGRQNLQVLAATGGGCAAAEFGRVLGLTGLSEVAGRKVRTYSQGVRQRLGLAAAMLGRPPLLIIDEPTNGLDHRGARAVRSGRHRGRHDRQRPACHDGGDSRLDAARAAVAGIAGIGRLSPATYVQAWMGFAPRRVPAHELLEQIRQRWPAPGPMAGLAGVLATAAVAAVIAGWRFAKDVTA